MVEMKKDVPLKIEMLSGDEDDRHRISSHGEIVHLLRHIADNGTRIALYYGNSSSEFLLTTLLDLDDEGLWLEQGPNPVENRRILESKRLIFVTSHLQVKVQFTSDKAYAVEHLGYPAFYFDLPDSIYRLQRREYFRLSTPVSSPLHCVVPTGHPARPVRHVTVMDISVGGIGLMTAESDSELVPGQTYTDCEIVLPEVGTVVVTVEVRNLVVITMPSGHELWRAGCEFRDLDSQSALLLQRYVTHMQRLLKAKS